MPPILVVGSRNAKKRLEIIDILGDLGIDLHDLSNWPDAPEVVENGKTFEENSRKKASELAKHLHQLVLGEDSGLVVPVLNGRPGVYSARYAGRQGDDEANNARLLAELAPLPDDRRAAYYVCSVALADPQGQIQGVAEAGPQPSRAGFGEASAHAVPPFALKESEPCPAMNQGGAYLWERKCCLMATCISVSGRHCGSKWKSSWRAAIQRNCRRILGQRA